MTKAKQSKRISISIPHDEWEAFQVLQAAMLGDIAEKLGVKDPRIASSVFRALVKSYKTLETPQEFSDLAMKAQLQRGKLYIAFRLDIEKNDK